MHRVRVRAPFIAAILGFAALFALTAAPSSAQIVNSSISSNFNGTATWEVRVLDGPWDLSQVNGGLLAFGRTQTNEIGFAWTHFNFGFTPTSSTVTVVLHYTALDPEWDYSFFGAYYDSLSLTDATTTCANPSNIMQHGACQRVLIRAISARSLTVRTLPRA